MCTHNPFICEVQQQRLKPGRHAICADTPQPSLASVFAVLAATPNERQRHNTKCKDVVSTLSQRVQQYNVLGEEYNKTLTPAAQPQPSSGPAPATQLWEQPRSSTTLDDVRKQQFSWVNEYACKCSTHRHGNGL